MIHKNSKKPKKIRNQKQEQKQVWKPADNYSEILRPMFDIGLNPWTVTKQQIPQNRFEITKMPDYRTILKYWDYWKEELVRQQTVSLAKTQREVKAMLSVSYDKQIMISETQLQDLLRYREELKTIHYKKEKNKVKASTSKTYVMEPYSPDLDLEMVISRINDLQGKQKMQKAGVEVAPMVDQLSEDAMIAELEAEQEKIAKKIQKDKNTGIIKVK